MKIRKLISAVEDIHQEAGIHAGEPLRKVAVAAIVDNPFAGKPYAADLSPLIDASADIGRQIAERALELMQPYEVLSYGKAGVVGLNGEQEHVVAMLTTIYGNVLRDVVGGGKAWISSFTKRSAPGMIVEVPLAHKDALFVRDHYDGMAIYLADGPLPNEMAIICSFANRGRLNARVGGVAANAIKGEDGLH